MSIRSRRQTRLTVTTPHDTAMTSMRSTLEQVRLQPTKFTLTWQSSVFHEFIQRYIGMKKAKDSILLQACRRSAYLCSTVPFFSGVPLVECCRVDGTSPENMIGGLPPV